MTTAATYEPLKAGCELSLAMEANWTGALVVEFPRITERRNHGGMEARIQFDGLSPLDGTACSLVFLHGRTIAATVCKFLHSPLSHSRLCFS